MAAETHISDVKIDVEAEETLVLHPAVLRDHQDVLFDDQVIDAVGNLLGVLGCLLDRGALVIVSHDLLDHPVDDVGLWCGFLALSFELFDHADDKH